MSLFYLAGLLVALAGMIVLDQRFRLFFWRDARRATIVLAIGLVFFLVWDVAGIRLGIFFRGETALMTGLALAPQLPLEEPLFLLLLCYLAMNLYGFFTRSRQDRPERPNSPRVELVETEPETDKP
jgi:lycopene cyclase domain-containing protein